MEECGLPFSEVKFPVAGQNSELHLELLVFIHFGPELAERVA